MKQLDVVVSPPAFVWDPNLTLTHVTFDLEVKCQRSDRQTDRQKAMKRAHHALAQVGSKIQKMWPETGKGHFGVTES